MAEIEPGPTESHVADGPLGALNPSELDRLAEIVYRLLKEDIIRGRERRGESMARAWR